MKCLFATAILFLPAFVYSYEAPTELRLLGFEVGRQGLVFRVPSGGCTKKNDIRVLVDLAGDGTPMLTLLRVRQDFCKGRMPHGKALWFTYEELGIDGNEEFVLSNPVGLATGPERPFEMGTAKR